MRILLVEDEPKLAKSIARALEEEGYAVDVEKDGLAADRRLSVHHGDYDLVILDLLLPGKDGISLCRDARERGIVTPVLMLTARDAVEDRVLGLDCGADDYLVKPFAFTELLSRIRALGRRPRTAHAPVLRVGSLVLDPATQEARCDDHTLPLTLKEFRLLEYFMARPHEAISRQDLFDHLWDFAANQLSRVVDVHVNNLRAKLTKHCDDVSIETIRGIGYRLRF